ncbi:hypothetical protein BDQ17DRAFT_1327012 [Cyathus striatus]|nr:hypothetical protein BDQ17DRAFT_1327012 [Cyathus striatus]
MAGPKNNLAEVLRGDATNASTSTRVCSFSPGSGSSTAAATGKRSKFKPATHTPIVQASLPPNIHHHLPSFSTTGFQYVSANKGSSTSISRANIHGNATEIPARANAVKRTSSDPSVSSDPSPQSLKKLKQNKENFDITSEPTVQNRLRYNVTDSEERGSMPVAYDPWAELDRDYPLSPAKPKKAKKKTLY